MANERSNALKSAADKIAEYVGKAATLTVETSYVELDSGIANFDLAKPAACTVIKLDGDCNSILPMRRAESGALEVDSALYDLHERNVATAIEYRTSMMGALLQALREATIR